MTDIARLVVRLEANQRQFERQLKRADAQAGKTTRRIERDFQRMERNVTTSSNRTGRAVSSTFQAVTAALSARQVTAYSDAWTEAGNKIAAAAQVAGLEARSLSDLNNIADENRAGIVETVDLYAKLLRASKGVANSEEEIALATGIAIKAFKAGGASTQEFKAGVLQLGQALGSGFLQGDELRSLRENAPLIAQAIADEFGVTIGKLKELGADGVLTSDRVFKAIIAGQPKIEAAFAQTNATIADGFTRLQNALVEYIAAGDASVDATGKITAALDLLGNNLNLVAIAAAALAVRGITPLAAALAVRLASAAGTASAALQLLAVQGGASLVVTSALARSMAFLGGPVGLATVALGGLFVAMSSTDSAAGDMTDALEDAETALIGASDISKKIARDYDALTLAQEELEAATAAGGEAAVAAAELDVAAVRDRITANKALREEYAILARERLRDAEASLKKLEAAELESLKRRKIQQEDPDFLQVSESGPRAGQFVSQVDTSREALERFAEAERETLVAASKTTDGLDDQQRELIENSKALNEAREKVEEMARQVDDLTGAASSSVSALDASGEAALRLGDRARASAEGVAKLISFIPELAKAERAEKSLAEARAARAAALASLDGAGAEGADERKRINALYEEAKNEITGVNEALRKQSEALKDVNELSDDFVDESKLAGLSGRARRVAELNREYQELRDQMVKAGAAAGDLADLDAAFQVRLKAVPADRAGRKKKPKTPIETALSDLAKREITSLKQQEELLGKNAGQRAEIIAKARLTEAAERRRIPITEKLATLIDDYASDIGEVAQKTADATERQGDLEEATRKSQEAAKQLREETERANSALVEGLVRAGIEADSFTGALKRIASELAVIAASDFFNGLLGQKTGGSSFGKLFADIGTSVGSSLLGGFGSTPAPPSPRRVKLGRVDPVAAAAASQPAGNVIINNNAKTEVSASRAGPSQRDLVIAIDDATAKNVSRRNSKTRRSLSSANSILER